MIAKENKDEWARITANICSLIKASPKSKSNIAREAGVSAPTLSQYLSGRAFPSLVTLKNLCNALDCSYEDILD